MSKNAPHAARMIVLFTFFMVLATLAGGAIAAPSSVTLAGDLQNELGCGGDWDPACAATHLTEQGNDVWRAAFSLPGGSYGYKMALDDSWGTSYPADNKPLSLGAVTDVRFYYDDKTHAVLDSVNDEIAVAAGSMQNELGCGGDWDPGCVNTLLTDADGDGIYTFAATGLPAAAYEFKVALDEAWDISYPGGNASFTINADSEVVTISWDSATTEVTVSVSSAPAVEWVVAGDFQSELGCGGNWNNTCAATTMEDGNGDGVFRLLADGLPAGGYEYKIVESNNWDNAYPPGNVPFTAGGGQMRWYFQPGPNNVADNANQCIATAVGNWQSVVGGGDWAPDNLRTMMWQEAPGSDWYSFSATLPAGSWEYKVARDEDWAEAYPGDNVALNLDAETAVTFRYNCATDEVAHVLGGEVPPEIADLVSEPVRDPIVDDVFYFVMPDRFANGDPSNDTGGISGTREDHGFDPTDMGFFHGGDLAGLMDQLDYLQNLGITAIWMTPVFHNNPVQGSGIDLSAGYHGYWYIDMTAFDPHFGTSAEMQTLIDEAHARGIKVFFDIITNHTADIVSYVENQYAYRDKETYPYKDANGDAFDDRDYVGSGTFPALDPAVSFPYTPTFLDPSGETAKTPAWLNNPIYYHNRGNSTFSGESSLYGDFFGLDDLWTEHPAVVSGMIDIYKDWISGYPIDGFRVDTVKHVNLEFWQEFMPAILAHAQTVRPQQDFFVFGEVFSGNPVLLSHYTSQADFPAVLDFNFQERVRSYASAGGNSDVLRDLFAADDYYTDADSNAYALPTFIGNHDRGRFGWFLNADNGSALSDSEMVARSELATAMMFFARGVPVIYYGDEQGFTGTGGDKEARQDMFPSQVPHYMAEDQIGTDATPADDNFDAAHVLYQAYADMAQLLVANPVLQTGAQLHRYSQASPGIYAFSRIDPVQALEYLVVLNNSTSPQTATFKTEGANVTYQEIYPGTGGTVTSSDTKEVSVSAPGVSVTVYKAGAPFAASESAPGVSFNTLSSGQEVPIGSQNLDGNDVQDRIEAGVALSSGQYAEVTFAVRKSGTDPYTVIGVDDNAPYRVFFSLADVPGGFVAGDKLDFVAVVKDSGGNLNYAEVTDIAPVLSAPPVGGEVTHAIIHYFRDDNDYGDHTTGDYNDYWGLHLWGDITETIDWTAPKPFLGEDEYGRFAWVNLMPNASNVGFIVHRGDTKDGTDADRFFNPSVTPEIWLRQDDANAYDSQAAAQGFVTIHYHREDGEYGTPSSDYTTFWGLHLWGDALADGAGTEWTSPRPFDGVDEFGAYWMVPIKNASAELNFIIHRGDAKDPGPDQMLVPAELPSAWIMSGDETIYPQRGAAQGFITLHYHRPASDYGDYSSTDFNDFWGLHTWGDADSPAWETPRKPAFMDVFGPAFQVPLTGGKQEIGYILHRGDEKDPGADQALNVNDWGYEVWQLQALVPTVPNEPQFILPLQVGPAGPNPGNIDSQEAYWVDKSTILWDKAGDSGLTYTLHYAPQGGLVATNNGITAGDSIVLTTGSASQEVKEKFPHLADLPALAIAEADWDKIPEILKGQIALSAVNAEGNSVDATGLQIPGVLDDLYTFSGELGVSWDNGVPTIRLWAPTAKSVALHLYDDSDPATTSSAAPMTLDPASGVWSITGSSSWKGKYYLFEIEVYVHATGQVEHNMVTDPYSLSLSMNSTRSQIVDLEDQSLKPAGWDETAKPELVAPEDISIYEIHVRDFSRSDPSVPAAYVGTYKAFTLPDSYGVRHLKALQAAGLSHLHLLPVFDIATIDEDKSNWQLEDWDDLAGYPTDGQQQQAAITAIEDLDGFNWGYDPFHYTTPEGSYSTNPDGATRIVEFREMVQAINEDIGLRVVMDVVYNHTNSAGQSDKSVLDKIVPGYYHRLDDEGNIETSTCCQNTATEHNMMEKLMIDSLVVWAKEYKVDAFRFDLMGHHMKYNMLNVRAALDALTLEKDGVDGKSIYLYGEGWNFGEVADNARGVNATQLNMAGTGIGTFSDRLRDAVRGGGPFDSGQDLVRNQGFANGLYYDPNALNSGSSSEWDELLLSTDQIRVGMAGNLADYEFIDRSGSLVTGAQVDYNGQPAGYTEDPQENISYISKHDNQTLYDNNTYKIPDGVSMEDRVRIQTVGLSTVILGQGVPFMQAGSDLLRSKSLDRDSYNSGDWFNKLDFTYESNNFGVGLPVAGKNQDNWSIMQPFLANTGLKADPEDIKINALMVQDLLAIRESSPLFHLETAADVQERVIFHNTGPNQLPGLIVMELDDHTMAEDMDSQFERIVVLVNANDEQQTFGNGFINDNIFILHPVQQASVDDVVKNSSYDAATGEFTVPGRTTAVFVTYEEPGTLIDDLIDDVNDLVDQGILNQGQGNALTVKLEQALSQLAKGKDDQAINALNAFINQVKALDQAGVLPPETAAALLAQANLIIELIELGV